MAILNKEILEAFFGASEAKCEFCDSVVRAVGESLDRNDFVYWHGGGGKLVICKGCIVTVFPSMLADVPSSRDVEDVLLRFQGRFWRARAHIEEGQRIAAERARYQPRDRGGESP